MRMAGILALVLLINSAATAKQMKPETVAAFNEYVRLTEQRIAREENSGPFLWVDSAPPEQRDSVYARLRRGDVVTQQLQTLKNGRAMSVPDGLLHHWIGVVFIPGAPLAKTVAFLQDYDQQHKFYAPEVERSRLLSRQGNDFHIYLRLRRKKVVTVVLNTEYDVHYRSLGNDRASARSYSRRIAQVQHADEREESEKPVGEDDGFLWRLNSYWRMWERDGGTYVQLEAISLTRDIPAGLGWLVRPFVTSVPEESLNFTLSRTRSGLCRAQ
jgi:hypothetical protein